MSRFLYVILSVSYDIIEKEVNCAQLHNDYSLDILFSDPLKK